MLYDSTNRMNQTLQIFRACRLFNYEFVASTNAHALRNEWHQFNKIPKAFPMLLNLMDEVDLYKRLATAEFSKAKAFPLEFLAALCFWRCHIYLILL